MMRLKNALVIMLFLLFIFGVAFSQTTYLTISRRSVSFFASDTLYRSEIKINLQNGEVFYRSKESKKFKLTKYKLQDSLLNFLKDSVTYSEISNSVSEKGFCDLGYRIIFENKVCDSKNRPNFYPCRTNIELIEIARLENDKPLINKIFKAHRFIMERI